MWPPIYVCNSYKFVPLLPETLFHFPKWFSWNVRMFYRSKQLIEYLNQQFKYKPLQAHSRNKSLLAFAAMWRRHGGLWTFKTYQFDRFNLITRRFNHQNDIIYRNVAPNIVCLQFVQICSTFTGNSVPLSETIFMECTNVLSFQTVKAMGGGGGGKHHFLSFHICSYVTELLNTNKKKKTDQNPTLRSWDIACQSLRFTCNY